jgi:RNA polymerase sigma-70 factor (ECF subfamily)
MGKSALLSSVFSITDEQAMWRVQMQDDQSAFLQLVQRWEQPIFRLCARMTGDTQRGEDLKQETFARVFARRKEYRPPGRFSTWLWRIALNLCYDELRHRKRRSECSLEAEQAESATPIWQNDNKEASPDLRLLAQEESELVRQALLELPEDRRTVLVLRYCEGLKLREIAEVLRIPETTASSRIAAGLAQLTRILEPELGSKR